MKKMPLIFAAILFCLMIFNSKILAQDSPPKGIYIIFDASGSMWQKLADDQFKIEVAKQVLSDFVASDFQGVELAFRAYGHRQKGDCRDSELIVPFKAPDKAIAPLKAFMSTVNPTGKTPISYSLRQALSDFGDRPGEIILISDGEETCDEDPCALVREWRDKNVKLKVHVVGFGLEEKAKASLKCISDAAGTEYRDANSASELAAGLSEIQKQAIPGVFILKGEDAGGNTRFNDMVIKVEGTLSRDGNPLYEVQSHYRNQVDAGEYVLTAGIRTRNGNLYKPVTDTVQVAESGESVTKVVVAIPPSAKAKLIDQGVEKRPHGLVYAYQDGENIFRFRAKDEIYLDEGTYEFRTQPNAESDLSLTESFAAGDHKTLEFKMVHVVRAKIKMIAEGSGIWFRQNYELWQNGEKKYNVHAHNGAKALPGTYDLHLPHKLFTYVHKGLVLTNEDEQTFEITVPAGHVTIIYQTADGARDKDKRCFVSSESVKRRAYHNSGQKYALLPGTYTVIGWQGEYTPVTFAVKEGEEQEVVLRAKK